MSLAIPVTDAHTGGTLVYSATGLPSGLSINSSTGAITGTLSHGGSWQPTVTVGDGTYTNSTSFNWYVGSPIVINDPGDQSNTVGDVVALPVVATDSASGTLTYSISGLPSGLSISSSTGAITGTLTGSVGSSPYTTTITVTDGTRTDTDTFSWYVNSAGPVIVTNPGSLTNAADDMVAMQIDATDTGNAPLFYTETGLPTGLYINPSTGFVFGTIASGATTGSPYSVTITATDPASNSASQTFSWTISAAGTVTVTNPGDQTNSEGDSVSLSVTSSDTGSGTMRYVAFGLPAGLAISTSTGAISGTVAIGAAANGPYTVTIVANDGTYSAAQSFNWTVNSPIALTAPADQTNNEADTVWLYLTASDSFCGSTLSYAALGLPPGLKINASTGAITGTVAKGAAANGPYSVTVMAEDGTYSSSQIFNWNVNSPITITVPDTQTNNDGDTASLTLSATDSISGSTLVYSVQGLPPGLSINASTGAITGTLPVGDSTLGSYFPTIIVSDGTYYSSAGFEWDINPAITIADPGAQANVVGDAISLQVTASGGGTLTYAATGLPNGLSISTSTGLISGPVGSGATAIGSFTTTVTVGDGTNTAVDTFAWTITGTSTVTLTTPSNQTNTEGDTASLSLSATDSGSGTLKYFAVGLPFGLKINPGTGAITGTVAVNDAAYGPYSVTVIATDGAYAAAETFTWTVNSPVTFSTIASQTNNESDTISLSAGATDSVSGSTLKYGAIGLPDGLKINTGTGAITGTLALGTAATGSFTVTVLAGDGTYSSSELITWGATNPVTLSQPTGQANNEGDTVSLSVSATYTGSGTLKYSAVGLPAGLKINAGTGAITGTVSPGAAANGPYTVLVTAGAGTYSSTQKFTWTVTDPITIIYPGIQTFSTGDTVSLYIKASDTRTGTTLSYEAVDLPEGLTMDFNTGEIYGTIDNTSDAAGPFLSTIEVSDGTSSAYQTVLWDVRDRTEGYVTTNDPKPTEDPTGMGSEPPQGKAPPGKVVTWWSFSDKLEDRTIPFGTGTATIGARVVVYAVIRDGTMTSVKEYVEFTIHANQDKQKDKELMNETHEMQFVQIDRYNDKNGTQLNNGGTWNTSYNTLGLAGGLAGGPIAGIMTRPKSRPKVYGKFGVLYLDAVSGKSPFGDLQEGPYTQYNSTSLRMWDSPTGGVSEKNQREDQTLMTYIVIGGKVAYSISWSASTYWSGVPAKPQIVYDIKGGNPVTSLPKYLTQETLLWGYEDANLKTRMTFANPVKGVYGKD